MHKPLPDEERRALALAGLRRYFDGINPKPMPPESGFTAFGELCDIVTSFKTELKTQRPQLFREVTRAIRREFDRELRKLNRAQPRKPQSKFAHAELKQTMARIAALLVEFGRNGSRVLPSREEIMEETKRSCAENYIFWNWGPLRGKSIRERYRFLRSKDAYARYLAAVEETVKQMSDRRGSGEIKGEIKWAQIMRELGLDALWPIPMGRPKKPKSESS